MTIQRKEENWRKQRKSCLDSYCTEFAKFPEYVEVLRLTAGEEIHRLFFVGRN